MPHKKVSSNAAEFCSDINVEGTAALYERMMRSSMLPFSDSESKALDEAGWQMIARDTKSVLKMGRGATLFGGLSATVVVAYCFDGERQLIDSMFYVDVDGYVWPSCDLSYRFMRLNRKSLSLGNVLDPDFDYYRAAVAFNIRNASRLPSTVVEPGYERHGLANSSRHYQVMDAARNVIIAKKIAKKLKIKVVPV